MIEADGANRFDQNRGPGARRLVLVAAGLLLTVTLAACSFRLPAWPRATRPSSIPSNPAPQTTALESGESPTLQPGALPDLTVTWMNLQIESGGACDFSSTDLGVRVFIANQGSSDASPFAVDVNGQRQSLPGLAAGARAELWFPGYVQQGENSAIVDAGSQVPETDEGNNRLAERLPIPTLPPTCTPTPGGLAQTGSTPRSTAAPTSTPGRPIPRPTSTPSPFEAPSRTPSPAPSDTPRPTLAPVVVRESTVTIATYPYSSFVIQARNDSFNMDYAVLDRDAYNAASPQPHDVTYSTLVVENEFLRLTFLPGLGGRLYEVLDKRTGHRATYRNPVLKPSPWGPPEQGWWLAAGGIEWCLPVEEHGYEWGVPWVARVSRDARGATITLRDTEAGDRVRAAIAVRLEAGAGSFTVRPRIENPTAQPLAVKYWTNAMLAPGGRNSVSSRLRFVLADGVTAVTVHSRGDDWLPNAAERMSWPVHSGIDFSGLGNWNRWLGFFENPAAGDFMAVYDEGYDEGMVRVFPSSVARGAKVFGFGWTDPIPPDNWTDDGSTYVELHGGPAETFDDSVTLPAGGHLEWTETWYPVAGLGGLRYANAAAALNLAAGTGHIEAGIAATRRWAGQIILSVDGAELWHGPVSLAAGRAWRQSVAAASPGSGRVRLRMEKQDGSLTADYETTLTW
jgi:hypothetical protein